MAKRLLVIGGVAAGPKSAAKARRCDPEMEIAIYQEEDEISYAGCGLPYYISGVIEEREDLISRTPGKFALDGIKILKNRKIEKIDIPSRSVLGRKIGSGETFTDHFDRLVLGFPYSDFGFQVSDFPRGVAQLAEHLTVDQVVAGSRPVSHPCINEPMCQ